MPQVSANFLPKYRKHKASGQAVVTLSGRDHYLGPHGTKASQQEYDRLVAEWIAGGRRPLAAESDRTVVELAAAYKVHCRTYYRGSTEYDAVVYSLRELCAMYGRTPVAEFGPLALKAVRQKIIEADLCRNEVNKRTRRIVRMFRWGVANELVAASVLQPNGL